MDWRASADYAFCAGLSRDQWAWEFLRRNPDYQADFAGFIAIWQALESDYGTPPQRDFQRWKQDPRAYGPLPGATADSLDEATGELCVVDDERVLIECWMGAKWGFHKFPLDPARATPPAPEELSWRPPPPAAPRPEGDVYRLDLVFDLARPLPPQLEAARLRLVSRATELRRRGLPAPLSVASERAKWTRWLRLLDAHTAGATLEAMKESGLCDGAENCAQELGEARAMSCRGYLDILRLAS
jgi:hypothetical protein